MSKVVANHLESIRCQCTHNASAERNQSNTLAPQQLGVVTQLMSLIVMLASAPELPVGVLANWSKNVGVHEHEEQPCRKHSHLLVAHSLLMQEVCRLDAGNKLVQLALQAPVDSIPDDIGLPWRCLDLCVCVCVTLCEV